ncbi:hypothetical protein CH249_11625 [Rhodococcus sp. 05-2255-3B1]|nr:hypothetical protein CH250_25135 [Rhodococcus sp. 05-2255-3C]OZE11402.1 hypothetical protein CH249_11625 [Rhodococcus sp. 05-2255-3B1]OZE13128.1 hypothetical protein CH255_25045 [Rhodococcus sp. 05-2255-2A2]
MWNVPKYISGDLALSALIGGVGFLIGLSIFSLRIRNGQDVPVTVAQSTLVKLDRVTHRMFFVVLASYVAWVLVARQQGAGPEQLLAAIQLKEGAVGDLKDVSAPVGGITTFTQFAPVVVAVRFLLLRVKFAERAYEIWIIGALSLGRAFLYGERLALIEIVVPLVVILVTVQNGTNRSIGRKRFGVLPVLALPGLWSVFAIFEYSRSWVYYKTQLTIPYYQFVSERLLGYYMTAVNNSALYYDAMHNRKYDPLFSFPSLWDSPVIGSLLGPARAGSNGLRSTWSYLLSTSGNPEFNNVGTFLVVDADLGTLGAFVYWLALGVGVGYAFYRLRMQSLVGIVAYSVVFVGLMEMVRIVYWVQGRFIPTLIAVAIVYFVAHSSKEGAERRGVSLAR